MIDPAYMELDKVLRAAIVQYLDNLPQEEKEGRLLVPFTPTIPEDPAEVEEFINCSVSPYEATTPQEREDLKQELIEHAEYLGLEFDEDLSLEEYQAVFRAKMDSMTNEERLAAGVFGKPMDEEEVALMKEDQIKHYMILIKDTAYNKILVSLGKRTPKEVDQEIEIAFSKEINLIIDHLKRRNLLN